MRMKLKTHQIRTLKRTPKRTSKRTLLDTDAPKSSPTLSPTAPKSVASLWISLRSSTSSPPPVLHCVSVSVLQYVAVSCCVLQWMNIALVVNLLASTCDAVCCSVFKCAKIRRFATNIAQIVNVLASTCVAVCCSVLQYTAVSCGVLQYVAVCCSVLQCVAVFCSAGYQIRISLRS